ncbi:DNA-binding response regulator/ompR family protein [Halomicronema hongdechloris C2206]|uniref:DNA-binding response regulator/ompR family protein n=1 Tax=Halomicronema hongdechloris C2206 TaxID=1641165 RepID=A0A1Z3HG95_9CYAN|nr:response regulator transcription factor [Halomicronema hongdechloris]ASC69312.1 DNA-binding response regulator/ompR family protein [Halomicronema hongdechloris C2206]
MRILLVEDDHHLAASLSEALEAQRYTVDVAHDGDIAWQQMTLLSYDLMLMDITLPQVDGLTLCQRLRSHGVVSPVLMLTARDTSGDKVAGLDAGADAYMVKPFDLSELIAQIRALLRRGQMAPPTTLQWELLQLNPTTYDVTYQDIPIRLTPKEFAILELLLRHGRRVLSRHFILESIWQLDDPPGEETVKAHLKALRQKLCKAGAPKNFIETMHGLGYRLN